MRYFVALAVAVAVAVSATTAVAGERSYTDEAGDSGTAPDLTGVTVTDSSGYLAFKIGTALVPSSSLLIRIDLDRNKSTGRDGVELIVGVNMEADGTGYWFVWRWSGTAWENLKIDVDSRGFAGRTEIGFRAADAGVTGTFDFDVISVKMVADAVEARDLAPDSVVPWTYELSVAEPATAVKAILGSPRLTPTRPRAGKPVTIRVSVTSGDTGQPLATGVATCSARVKNRTVRGTASVTAGVATCRLAVPRGSTSATGRGSLTVGTGALAVSRSFTFRIA